MNMNFEIGVQYYGDFAELSYEWRQCHAEDEIRRENHGKTSYPVYDCLFGNAVYEGKASGCRCSYCNREIENGYRFRDEDGHVYNYGPECVNKAI